LQGDKAVDSIAGQLKVIGRVSGHFDAVAIIRGGGGDVGLNCYDNYMLAREVALCPLPVLTGIGHSTNETVVEMVAGYNKITPTDVAYFLIQQFHNFSARIRESGEKIETYTRNMIEDEKRRWGELTRRLLLQTDNLLKQERGKHQLALSRLRFKPGLLIHEKQIDLKNRTSWLTMRIKQLINQQNQSLDALGQKVQLLDPQQILKRGYSITYFDGKPLTNSYGLNPGDKILTQLHKGSICSEIKSKQE
jgi:exodeoxyribonuclease VII large subunit